MVAGELFGAAVVGMLAIGCIWALVDLLVRIHRLPKKGDSASWWVLSPYPFVPHERPQANASANAEPDLRLAPVPVKSAKDHGER